MSFLRCAVDQQRIQGHVRHVYWYWTDLAGNQGRFRQRLCTPHLYSELISLCGDLDQESVTCPACGILTEDDPTPVYATYYDDQKQRVDVALPFCEPHGLAVRAAAQVGATEMPDRDPADTESIGYESYTPTETLKSLGRVLR